MGGTPSKSAAGVEAWGEPLTLGNDLIHLLRVMKTPETEKVPSCLPNRSSLGVK